MKVEVIKRYSDVVTRKIHEEGFVFETDEKRARHLVKEGVAKIVEEPVGEPEQKAEKPAKGKAVAPERKE